MLKDSSRASHAAAVTPMRITPSNLASVLPPGGLTLVQGCSGESVLLADAVTELGAAAGAMRFSGVFVAGLNRTNWLANPECRVETFFMTPELKRAGAAVDFLPLCYADILAHLRNAKISAAVFMVSPPDRNGICSFGPVVDFLAELWPQIPVRIAHINPSMPHTYGQAGIPFAELSGVIEKDVPLLGMEEEAGDALASAIGGHVAGFIPAHATIQTGLGKIPGAVLRALTGHRGLKIHSGLGGDAVLDLVGAGALAEGAAITAGVAIGSPRLYRAISAPMFSFRPVSYTHSMTVLAQIPLLRTINSAIAVDLYGQVYAELTPRGLMSGPGGAGDFARGAKAAGGVRIIALPAGADGGKISRIVVPGQGPGPVSLGRQDVDVIVTEHGAADLRGLSHAQRAAALIKVAPPSHREALAAGWQAVYKTF